MSDFTYPPTDPFRRKQPWCYRGHDVATRRYLCFCGCGRPVFPPRRTAHSKECVDRFDRHSNLVKIRRIVGKRDHGVCALCGTQNHTWEADHILPVCEGGGGCGPEGYRTLCRACHRKQTALLAGRRALRRKTTTQLELIPAT